MESYKYHILSAKVRYSATKEETRFQTEITGTLEEAKKMFVDHVHRNGYKLIGRVKRELSY